MSDTSISIGNTPIFDQLQREFAARGRAYDSLIAGGPINLRPARLQGARPQYAVVDELGEVEGMLEQTDETVNAAEKTNPTVVKTLRQHFEKETIDTTYDDIREAAASMSPFHEFSKNYPEPVSVTPLDLQRVLIGVMSPNGLRRKYLESNDSEPDEGSR